MNMRHKAIHFRPEIDHDDRELALSAIKCLQKIIGSQFSGYGAQPWFITGIPGEIYIKKDWERNPFVSKVYIPCCAHVGPYHVIEALYPKIIINDRFKYETKRISDEELCYKSRRYKALTIRQIPVESTDCLTWISRTGHHRIQNWQYAILISGCANLLKRSVGSAAIKLI